MLGYQRKPNHPTGSLRETLVRSPHPNGKHESKPVEVLAFLKGGIPRRETPKGLTMFVPTGWFNQVEQSFRELQLPVFDTPNRK